MQIKFVFSAVMLSGLAVTVSAQTIGERYVQRDYPALVKFENKADSLSGEELYMIGFAFFQLENDKKAIAMYDKAIAKGYTTGSVYFYKGLSLRYQKSYPEALREIEKALEKEPTNQEFMNEKGLVYYYQEKPEKALAVFEEAKKLPATFPEPFYWSARIHHEAGKFDKALEGYYEAAAIIPPENSHYLTTLGAIGMLEYTHTHNYEKSVAAYRKAIKTSPDDYELHSKIMKSFNAAKQFAQADSVFDVLKGLFDKGKLPKEYMDIKSISIAQFEWNGQVATIRRSFVEPKEMTEISYKIFLLNKAGDKVVRRFMIEKTIQLGEDGAHYLLCEQDKETNTHHTFPYGWKTDVINADAIEKGVRLVLDEKMKSGASSKSGR